jgi:hypothetical protein
MHLGIEHKPTKLKYKTIRDFIYKLIVDVNIIMTNTIANIVKGNKIGNGFSYISELNISIQDLNANTCIVEIINQCKKNNISINMQIKLKNNEIINIDC